MDTIGKKILIILLAGLFLVSCEKNDDIDKIPYLKLSENSISNTLLSADGGVATLQVESGYTTWKVTPGDPIQGEKFITGISPANGGSSEKNMQIEEIEIAYKSNTNDTRNIQYLVFEALTGNISDTILITQEAKELKSVLLVIDPSTEYQTIAGFGGANNIWGSDYLSEIEMDLAFGMESDQLGLSLFRVRLPSNKDDWAGLVNCIKTANAHNVKILASPWSPPQEWKSNNSINGGGYLLEEYYDDFIAYINEFIKFMSDQGAVIDVISLQNEPDWEVSYEGCEYTKEQMYDLVRNYAGEITGAKVLGVESLKTNKQYTDLILEDPVAAANLDIVGGHLYGSGLAYYPLAETKGKEIWMTEHLLNLNSGNLPENWTSSTSPSVIWDETMEMVQEIQSALTYNWNAYIWWYIRRYYSFLGDGTNGTRRRKILKRGYAMAQFSKFIRPGYIRIDAHLENNTSDLTVSAFKGDNKITLVIINPVNVDVEGICLTCTGQINTVKSYSTSLDDNLKELNHTAVDNNIILNFKAKSITTVVIN